MVDRWLTQNCGLWSAGSWSRRHSLNEAPDGSRRVGASVVEAKMRG